MNIGTALEQLIHAGEWGGCAVLHRYSEILNLPVICIDKGEKAGTVKDFIFNPEGREVKALLLEHKGLELNKKLVMIKDILSLGTDAVVVESPSMIQELGRAEYNRAFKDEGNVIGLRIFTKAGKDLGVVKDIFFDWKNGRIEGVEVSDGLLQDVVLGRKILPLFGKVEFGEENILVDREAVEEMENTGGGIKNRLFR